MYRRNVVLVLSLAASLLLFSRPLQAAEEGNNGMRMQIGKSETFVYLKAEKFVWKESDEGGRLLEESGPRYGLGIVHHAVRNGMTFRPMAEIYGGTVDYDGQTQGGTPLATETNYLGGKIAFDAGGVITLNPSFFLESFVGFGIDYWERDIESTSVGIGYLEQWSSYSVRGGLRGEAGSGSTGVRIFGEAALKYPFSNENRAEFPGLGKLTVRPEGEIGWSAEAGMKAGPVRIAFFYEMVRFSKSDITAVLVAPGDTQFFLQPDSEYSVYGLTAGWVF